MVDGAPKIDGPFVVARIAGGFRRGYQWQGCNLRSSYCRKQVFFGVGNECGTAIVDTGRLFLRSVSCQSMTVKRSEGFEEGGLTGDARQRGRVMMIVLRTRQRARNAAVGELLHMLKGEGGRLPPSPASPLLELRYCKAPVMQFRISGPNQTSPFEPLFRETLSIVDEVLQYHTLGRRHICYRNIYRCRLSCAPMPENLVHFYLNLQPHKQTQISTSRKSRPKKPQERAKQA